MTRLPTFLTLLSALLLTPPLLAQDSQPRLLTTNGYGEVQVSADQALVQMQVTATHKSAGEAKASADQRVNQLLDKLARLGIAEKDIVASSLRINPDYEYNNRQQVFTGYSASRAVTVTLRKLDNLDRLLSAAVDSGVNQIGQISLENSEADKHRQEAHQRAIADSKAKAQALAKAYGAELGPIHRISYHSNGVPFPLERAESGVMKMAVAADAGGGRYLHDEITYSDNIEVAFELIIPR